MLLSQLKLIFLISIVVVLFFILIIVSIIFQSHKLVDNLHQKNFELVLLKEELSNNCEFISAETLLEYGISNTFKPSKIPKIVHYTYSGDYLPEQYYHLVKKCININSRSAILFVFWTDQTAYSLIKKYYSDKLEIYNSYITDNRERLKKTDLIRMFILHKFGGIYMDLDNRCQDSFEKTFEIDAKLHHNQYSNCIISTDNPDKLAILYDIEFCTMNSFIACIPQHNLIKFSINKFALNNNNINIIYLTGPNFLTDVTIKYKNISKDEQNTTNYIAFNDEVMQRNLNLNRAFSYGHWTVYSPYIDFSIDNFCHPTLARKELVLRNKTCLRKDEIKRQQKPLIDNASIVHLFLHLGYTINDNKGINKTFAICSFKPTIYLVDVTKSD